MNSEQKKHFSPRGFPQAVVSLCRWQKVALVFGVMSFLCVGFFYWRLELLWTNLFLTVFYFLSMLYRVFIMGVALKNPNEITIPEEQLSVLPECFSVWPKYLILLPMYDEGTVLPDLIHSLEQLDYPADRLEIRLLIEEDDEKTRAAAALIDMPKQFVVTLIPVSEPRTKPKACNVGILGAEADFLVIYDAEDRPEADQLKKAVHAFAQVPEKVVCIQAKLGYYNAKQNLLTRCFAAEYATWFGLCLPGLDYLRAPIPLGGTSNHFRFQLLKKIGAWDEYNVTEDCDLGLRLFIAGWQTRILESTTWEQACPKLGAWIRQRSRWVKGYIQTYLVHMRDLFGTHRKLGVWNSFQFHLLIGGSFFTQLINPIYWSLTLAWLIWQPKSVEYFYPLPILLMGSACLFVGNFIFLYTSCIACQRRNLSDLVKYCVVLMPFYWLLMSIGAWKGFLQLITRPSHWEKTPHFKEIVTSPDVLFRKNNN